DVGRTRGYAPPRIHLGAPQENPVVLTRQDWRGPHASWGPTGLGHWEVAVVRDGAFDMTLRCEPSPKARTARLGLRGVFLARELPANATHCTFEDVRLSAGDGRLEAWLLQGEERVGVLDVEVRKRD